MSATSPLVASASAQLVRRSPPRSAQPRTSASTGEIRFLDVANYVGREIGRSLRQQHSQQAARTPGAASRSVASATSPKSQLAWAGREQMAEKRQLEASASQSSGPSKLASEVQKQRDSKSSPSTEVASSTNAREAREDAEFSDLARNAIQKQKGDSSLPGTLEEYCFNAPERRARATHGGETQQFVRGNLSMQGSTQTESEVCEALRESIRKSLLAGANGSAWQAFKVLDTSGSGRVSQQDFAPGVSRLGVDWPKITGLKMERDLFKLFDTQKAGLIRFADLFPVEAARGADTERCGTTEFWGRWCRKNRDAENMQRGPKWTSSSPEEELKILYDAVHHREEVADKRKWMRATMRRLKSQGKSDARCREAVALHLPRGTGPKDRDGVQTVSVHDVKQSRKRYNEEVKEHASNAQSVVNEMREQRKVLQNSKQRLFMVTEGPSNRKRAGEEMKQQLASFGSPGLLKKIHEDTVHEHEFSGQDATEAGEAAGKYASQPGEGKSDQTIAKECNLELEEVEDLHKDYQKLADSTDHLGRKGFAKLLPQLSPSRTLAETDVEAWWEQACTAKDRRALINFAQFVVWFSHSELREMRT